MDLQVPAIMTYLERHGLSLQGTEVVDIGSWKGKASHAISIRLSPLHIQVTGDPKNDAGAVLAGEEVPGRVGRNVICR